MEQFFIVGGNKLNGEVQIDSAKNSLLPIMACSILIEGQVRIERVVGYSDVFAMIDILENLGSKVYWEKDDLIIDNSSLSSNEVPNELASPLRSSIFCLGPILARLGSVKIAYPGGCDIGLRPIDLHLSGARNLGAKVVEKNGYIYARKEKMQAKDIALSFASVGATENLMMLATCIEGETRIINCAKEPEIVDLANFINKAGGRVCGAGTDVVSIQGGKKLHSLSFRPITDRIEAGTFLIAGAMTGGEIVVKGANPQQNQELLSKLIKSACKIKCENDTIILTRNGKLKSFGEIETGVYPAFPTDLQSQMTALSSISDGYSLIIENIFESRNKHIGQLKKMGADLISRNGIVIAKGQKHLFGADVSAGDLRGGASLVLAGLVAQGYTTIDNICYIDRGYKNIEEKFTALGGDIKRVKVEKEINNQCM
ncbi:MAG: UDP-N-acetylglucosamine 1-carboxyvinyltransferase [Clostridiales bacterium]|nr:UDP-N-acetylglucosamine 1-carboxyvinyltransferase [Clostridiales bacterium]